MRICLGFAISALLHALIFMIPVDLPGSREPPPPELQFVLIHASAPASMATGEAPPEPPPPKPPAAKAPPRPDAARKPPPREKPPRPREKAVEIPEEPPPEAPAPTAEVRESSGEPQSSLAAQSPGAGPRGPVDAAFGSGDGPRFLHKAMPRYPRLARELGKEGTVLLRLTIDEGGSLTHVEVLKGAGSGFDEEALRAVRESRFSPARMNGRTVASRARLPIRFVLRSSEND